MCPEMSRNEDCSVSVSRCLSLAGHQTLSYWKPQPVICCHIGHGTQSNTKRPCSLHTIYKVSHQWKLHPRRDIHTWVWSWTIIIIIINFIKYRHWYASQLGPMHLAHSGLMCMCSASFGVAHSSSAPCMLSIYSGTVRARMLLYCGCLSITRFITFTLINHAHYAAHVKVTCNLTTL